MINRKLVFRSLKGRCRGNQFCKPYPHSWVSEFRRYSPDTGTAVTDERSSACGVDGRRPEYCVADVAENDLENFGWKPPKVRSELQMRRRRSSRSTPHPVWTNPELSQTRHVNEKLSGVMSVFYLTSFYFSCLLHICLSSVCCHLMRTVIFYLCICMLVQSVSVISLAVFLWALLPEIKRIITDDKIT